MVSWVFGIHRRFADLGAIELVTATNVPKCWVSPPVPPGLTLVGMRCSCSFVPHRFGVFPMSFSHQDQGVPVCLTLGSLISPLQMVSSLQLGFPMETGMICYIWIGFQEELWEFPWCSGSMCHPAHEGIGIRCSPRATVVNKPWVKEDLHGSVRELLRAVRVCSVIQLQKCANVLDKRF